MRGKESGRDSSGLVCGWREGWLVLAGVGFGLVGMTFLFAGFSCATLKAPFFIRCERRRSFSSEVNVVYGNADDFASLLFLGKFCLLSCCSSLC